MKPSNKQLPLAVRKELLRTRAMLERLEYTNATQNIQSHFAHDGLVGTVSRSLVGEKHQAKLDVAKQGWSGAMKAVEAVKEHPMLSSAASYVLSSLGKSQGGWWSRATKLGVLAAVGYVGYQKVQEARQERQAELAELALEEGNNVGYEGGELPPAEAHLPPAEV